MQPMEMLIVFNREPCDNTDVTWNALRLAGKLRKADQELRMFLVPQAQVTDTYLDIRREAD
jgi:uncharacterized protein involved in oxidation of intracellular sulfur